MLSQEDSTIHPTNDSINTRKKDCHKSFQNFVINAMIETTLRLIKSLRKYCITEQFESKFTFTEIMAS